MSDPPAFWRINYADNPEPYRKLIVSTSAGHWKVAGGINQFGSMTLTIEMQSARPHGEVSITMPLSGDYARELRHLLGELLKLAGEPVDG